MRNNCMTHFSVFNIFNTELFAGLFNDFADGRVVHMRDFWKQMMFYLEIQSTNQPGDQFVFCGKICSGLNLVNSPFIFNSIGISIGTGKAVSSTVCAS